MEGERVVNETAVRVRLTHILLLVIIVELLIALIWGWSNA
jgi:hypothetical protein